MAEFGSQITQLSAPQGAGATPIEPVREAVVPNLAVSLFADLSKGFIRGIADNRKAEAEAAKNATLSQYAREREKINNGVVSGELDPIRASTLTRALNTRYLAGNAGLADDLDKLDRSFKGMTEAEQVEDAVKLAKNVRDKDIEEVRARGGLIYPGMSNEAIDSQIVATKTSIRAENEFNEMVKRNQENRAQNEFDMRIQDRTMKETSTRLLTDIAGANLDAFQKFGQSIVNDFKGGKLSPDQAKQTLQAYWSRINGSLNAASAANPELASPFKGLFDDIGKIYSSMLDPKAVTEDLENQLKQIKYKTQLVLLANPKVRAAAGVTELLGPNAQVALAAANPAINEIVNLINNPPDGPIPPPQIVGNPENEKEVFDFLKSSLSKIDTGAYKDNEKAKQEAKNAVNNVLGQVSGFIDKGSQSPIKLSAAAQFFASPSFGQSASKGLFDPEAMQGAKKVFQLQYEDVVLRGIQQKMDRVFVTTPGSVPAPGTNTPKVKEKTNKVGNLIDIQFTGTGVTFVAKPGAAKTDEDIRQQRNTLTDLKTVQQAVNQLVHIGAHMEGTTNYQQYWEANKHRIFPDSGFPIPQAAPSTTGPINNEKQLKAAAQLSPTERAASEAFEASDANVRELQKELARTDLSPAARDVLEKEYIKLRGNRK